MPQAINSTRLLWSASNDPADYLQRIRAIHPFGPKQAGKKMTVSPMLQRDDDSIHVSATELSITATPWEDWPGSGKNSVFFSVRLQAAQASIAGVLTKTEAVAIAQALMEAAQ